MTKTANLTTPEVVVATREGARDKRIRISLPADFPATLRIPGAGVVPFDDVIRGLVAGEFDIAAQIKLKEKLEREQKRARELEKLVRQSMTHDELRQAILGIAAMQPNKPDWDFNYKDEPGYPGVPMAVLSDIHFGEVVTLKQMGGCNQYNVEIAEERLKTWTSKIIEMCFEHEVWKGTYPGLVLCLGGDMISGDIHEELKESNELSTPVTLLRLAGVLERAIEELADKFGKVMIPCVTGNHGRMNKKPQAKGYNDDNYETILYLLLERAFKDDDRIKFVFPNETLVHFRVNNTDYALTHGNLMGVKGGDGIIGAIGPITRGAFKTGNSEASKPNGKRPRYMIMGHWHTAMRLPNAFVNGSVKGFDEYAQDFLRTGFERPGQILWRDHPEHGPVRFEVIYTDKDMQRLAKPRPPAPWFESDARYADHWSDANPFAEVSQPPRFVQDNEEETGPDNFRPVPAHDANRRQRQRRAG